MEGGSKDDPSADKKQNTQPVIRHDHLVAGGCTHWRFPEKRLENSQRLHGGDSFWNCYSRLPAATTASGGDASVFAIVTTQADILWPLHEARLLSPFEEARQVSTHLGHSGGSSFLPSAECSHCALHSLDAARSILGQPVTVTVSSVYR